MRLKFRARLIAACVVSSLLSSTLVPSAHAIIVAGGNGTGSANVQPGSPAPVAGWQNVGTIAGASGVYLGNRWAITASHLGIGGVLSAGTPFTLPNGTVLATDQTSTRLVNPSDSSPTDLILLHFSSDPGLPTLSIASATPTIGTSIYMMGYGLTRSAGVQFYNVTGSGASTTWTPLPNSTGANESGYTESSPNVNRWGTNITATAPGEAPGTATAVYNAGFGNVTLFSADFDSAGTSSEAQVSLGDSGGGVFSSGNVLLGINDLSFTFDNQPANTAVFGDASGFVDLATYRSQILAISGIPEPTSITSLLTAMGLLLMKRRVRVTKR